MKQFARQLAAGVMLAAALGMSALAVGVVQRPLEVVQAPKTQLPDDPPPDCSITDCDDNSR